MSMSPLTVELEQKHLKSSKYLFFVKPHVELVPVGQVGHHPRDGPQRDVVGVEGSTL